MLLRRLQLLVLAGNDPGPRDYGGEHDGQLQQDRILSDRRLDLFSFFGERGAGCPFNTDHLILGCIPA